MKAKDLKPPFDWENRRVLVKDRVFYVPLRHEDAEPFHFPGWQHTDFFGNANPVHVEYCSGNGAWIIDKALNNPEINWVGVEMKFQRVRKIWAKIKTLNIPNLMVVHGEGYNATRHYFPTESVTHTYINFPDPWPKNKHAKHRLVQGEFTQEVARILYPQGTFTLVTDDPDYSEQMLSILSNCENFAPEYPEPHYRTDIENYGKSFFEDLWRARARQIRYHLFKKVTK